LCLSSSSGDDDDGLLIPPSSSSGILPSCSCFFGASPSWPRGGDDAIEIFLSSKAAGCFGSVVSAGVPAGGDCDVAGSVAAMGFNGADDGDKSEYVGGGAGGNGCREGGGRGQDVTGGRDERRRGGGLKYGGGGGGGGGGGNGGDGLRLGDGSAV
jgi:hypothetical protein